MKSSSVSPARHVERIIIQRDAHRNPNLPFKDPSLKLYQNSKEVDSYTGDRSHGHLTDYIQDKSRNFARSLSQSVLVNEAGQAKAASVVNGEGISVSVQEEELERMIKDGPVFVKYYAPWCGQ